MQIPITFTSVILLSSFSFTGVSGKCFTSGINWSNKDTAVGHVEAACRGGVFTGVFKPGQRKYLCVRAGENVKWEFAITNQNTRDSFDLQDEHFNQLLRQHALHHHPHHRCRDPRINRNSSPKTETFATASVYAFNRDQNTHKFVDVPFGKLTHIDYQITDLELRGVQFLLPDGEKIDPDKVTCQMYKDSLGTQPGSAAFTKQTPAHISLFNPVQFGWVLCYVNVGSA
ncbi:hypothetical protein RAB80_009591 [Fusarium oxysporum f. sp. vasinfectum]|nr:hypothetical protein RAB80_009591 [Fusarium oxysporum f. sp. vasinfectum]